MMRRPVIVALAQRKTRDHDNFDSQGVTTKLNNLMPWILDDVHWPMTVVRTFPSEKGFEIGRTMKPLTIPFPSRTN